MPLIFSVTFSLNRTCEFIVQSACLNMVIFACEGLTTLATKFYRVKRCILTGVTVHFFVLQF